MPSGAGPNGVFGRVSETQRPAAPRRRGSALSLPRPRLDSRARPRRAGGHLQRRQRRERPRGAGPERGGGSMELKKDDQAVAIDMLLIVNSEKRRAAQGAHSDRQADPQPQRRGGNARGPGFPARRPRPSSPGGPPVAGRPLTTGGQARFSACPTAAVPPHRGPSVPWCPKLTSGAGPWVQGSPWGTDFLPMPPRRVQIRAA